MAAHDGPEDVPELVQVRDVAGRVSASFGGTVLPDGRLAFRIDLVRPPGPLMAPEVAAALIVAVGRLGGRPIPPAERAQIDRVAAISRGLRRTIAALENWGEPPKDKPS